MVGAAVRFRLNECVPFETVSSVLLLLLVDAGTGAAGRGGRIGNGSVVRAFSGVSGSIQFAMAAIVGQRQHHSAIKHSSRNMLLLPFRSGN